MSRLSRTARLTILCLSAAACGGKPETTAVRDPAPTPAPSASADDAGAERVRAGLEAGVEAVVYGLPLVLMDASKRKMTNVSAAGEQQAPVNQFAHMRASPDASFKDVVRANVDTLYSSAWLDLSKEPVVLSVPDSKGRYYLLPMLDGWTNVFASPGKRTTGTKAGQYAITGPGWTGELPKGVQRLEAPTNMVWIVGRTQTNGPKDYAAVHAFQAQLRLTPLSAHSKPATAPVGVVDPDPALDLPPVEAVAAMGTKEFLGRLAMLLRDNPAPASDGPALDALARLGVVPGQPFDASKLDPAFAAGLESALPAALGKLSEAAKALGEPTNGWHVPPMSLGDFGTDYATRAVVALIGLGANVPSDAVYPTAYVDAAGAPLDGGAGYVLHFDAGQEPPVEAFWSLTMYSPDSFFVDNPLGRYAISSWMPLQRNADGSLDILIQHQSPGPAKERNWLPAPDGPFNVTLRMYWPRAAAPSILDGSWTPPAITPAR